MDFARSLWLRIETLHALTYFGEETQEAGTAAGLGGFWMGYFGFRAAPMGAVAAGVVEATFSNFAPSFVARWVPGVWEVASPAGLIARRSEAAAATLRRVAPMVDEAARAAAPWLDLAIAEGLGPGRPLFAANRNVPLPGDPVEDLWQRCTTLREHRGDGHVAALATEGIDGIEAHVLIAADQGADPGDLQRTRGWTADDWTGAVRRLQHRGLITADGGLTDHGRDLRQAVEDTTDRLAAAPFAHLSEVERTRLIDVLTPAARAVATSGVIRYPNPMGLPPLA
ncbi:SCO6745 family protein [Aquihabitans sp. McL0605]|uniref:SCO6745 family protein n=1 Tax=Aquihabitans sp. McL0605 TaxID=3415671 RepID=UPI003CF683B4